MIELKKGSWYYCHCGFSIGGCIFQFSKTAGEQGVIALKSYYSVNSKFNQSIVNVCLHVRSEQNELREITEKEAISLII